MKQFLKRGLAILTAFILCLQFGKIDAQAANVVIALSASTVSVGNNVTATISVSGSDISAYTIYVSYNSSVLQYNSASGSAIVNGGGGTVTASGTSAGSFSISFTAIAMVAEVSQQAEVMFMISTAMPYQSPMQVQR